MLTDHPLAQVGEIGLDFCGDHTPESKKFQIGVFECQLDIALSSLASAELERICSVHCVRAHGEMLKVLKKRFGHRAAAKTGGIKPAAIVEGEPAGESRMPTLIMHSFGGSIEIARRLLPLGALFSFSGHFLHPRKHAVIEVFKQLPPQRILLETDAPDMLPPPEHITHPLPGSHHHPANLPAIGRALAAALGMPEDELASITRDNARTCFGF